MKTFDEQLEAAFEAGADWAFDHNRSDLSPRPDSPGFAEWRAGLSGFELSEPVQETEADIERRLTTHLL